MIEENVGAAMSRRRSLGVERGRSVHCELFQSEASRKSDSGKINEYTGETMAQLRSSNSHTCVEICLTLATLAHA